MSPSAMPATQNRGQCRKVPRLPCKTKVDVTKCHACHVKRRWMSPSATLATQKCRGVNRDQAAPSAPPDPAMCQKCHACHAKCKWMSPSAMLATQKCRGVNRDQGAPSASPDPAQSHQCHACHEKRRWMSVTKCHACHAKRRWMSVTKCHACHAKRRWMSPSSTPATQTAAASTASNGNQARHQSQPSPSPISARPATHNEGRCREVSRLPRKTKVDVTKWHACHVKRRWMSPSATPATQKCHGVNRDQGAPSASPTQPSPTSATPATQNNGGPAQSQKCLACHAKQRWTSPSTASVKKAAAPHGVTGDPSASPEPAQSHKYHACDARRRWMSPSATPATQEGHGATRRHGRSKRVTRASPVPKVPRLPRKTTVDATKRHACHMKRRWMSPSATPAIMQKGRGATRRHGRSKRATRASPVPYK